MKTPLVYVAVRAVQPRSDVPARRTRTAGPDVRRAAEPRDAWWHHHPWSYQLSVPRFPRRSRDALPGAGAS